MKKSISVFYKKYCRVVDKNVVIEMEKGADGVRYTCPAKKTCREKYCHVEHLLNNIYK